jgi:hypothetical protein
LGGIAEKVPHPHYPCNAAFQKLFRVPGPSGAHRKRRKIFRVPSNRAEVSGLFKDEARMRGPMKDYPEDVIPIAVMGALSVAILLVFAVTV